MKSSPFRVIGLAVVPLFFTAVLSAGACREPSRQAATESRAAPPAAIKPPLPKSNPPIDASDCAAVRADSERWLSDIGRAMVVDDNEDEEEAEAGATPQPRIPRRDPLPPKYADKLAALLQKGVLCERSKRGTWLIRYSRDELSAQPPGDVLLPWSLVHIGADGKRTEISADPEDNSSADFAKSQDEADKGALPQRPRFFAAVGARFYIPERARQEGELALPDSLLLYDYDGDGEEEAIVTEHSNSLGRQERTVTIWSFRHGRIEPYALAWHRTAEAVSDVDGDGRPDLLYRPFWGEAGTVGAALALAHALPNGSFSTTDAAVAAFHDKQPPPLPTREEEAAAKDKDAHAPPPLARMSSRPPTGMLCKREYERTRALLATAPHYFARQHVADARSAAEGLQSLLRKSSFCRPSHGGAWAVTFSGYQFGGEVASEHPPAHQVVAEWSFSHLGTDGTRVTYELPPPPTTTLGPNHPAAVGAMLPFDATSLVNLEFYSRGEEESCRQGYDLPSDLRVVDYDQRGEEEAIFATRSSQEGCPGEKFYLDPLGIFTLRDGKIVPYDTKWHQHFDRLEDVDGDGRPDLIYRPYRTAEDLDAECPDTHDGDTHDPFVHGPEFAAHALAQGGFSTVDDKAREYARRACPQRPRGPVGGDGILCARLWGVPAKVILQAHFGDRPCTGCEDCASRRRTTSWIERQPPLHLP